jgi:hypothetical protein
MLAVRCPRRQGARLAPAAPRPRSPSRASSSAVAPSRRPAYARGTHAYGPSRGRNTTRGPAPPPGACPAGDPACRGGPIVDALRARRCQGAWCRGLSHPPACLRALAAATVLRSGRPPRRPDRRRGTAGETTDAGGAHLPTRSAAPAERLPDRPWLRPAGHGNASSLGRRGAPGREAQDTARTRILC